MNDGAGVPPVPRPAPDEIPDQAVLDAIARTDFASFVVRSFFHVSPARSFKPNWHIEALAYHLEQVRCGKIKRLIINVPPRSLKSTIASVAFPAYLLGHDPTKRIITVSYGAGLAAKHANDFRAILGSDWYRRMFPGTRIAAKNTEAEVVTTANGFRLTTSLDGTLTGRGGDIIIIDDPLKPDDALSDARREKVNDWYFNTLLSRLDDKQDGAIIIVMQRLHMEDLVGVLLRGSNEWTHLNLKAIADEDERIQIGENEYHLRRAGEALHPDHEPIPMLESLRSQFGPDTFAAQYQQEPVPRGGAMIKRDWIRRYDTLPDVGYRRVLQSWDTAAKDGLSNDYSVCTTWLLHDDKFYLMDVVRARFNYPALRECAIQHAKLHRPTQVLIEDAGVGIALAQELRRQGLYINAVRPERDKRTRMEIQCGKFFSGQVYLPYRASWLPELERELFSFPQVKHDDQVDSISQALTSQYPGYDVTMSGVD